MRTVRVAWSAEFVEYDFGEGHPMTPLRLDLTWRLIRDLGLIDHADVEVVDADPASDEVLQRVHTRDYIAAVKAASAAPPVVDVASGLGTMDVPVFPGMHEASARIAQASRDAALAVWSGEVAHGVNIAGGLHHAMPSLASGFCVYNDAALAVAALLDAGAERVAYVDVDVHHGDGVERIFWDEPRVLTVSLHETGRVLFPGTGFPQDTGGSRADGCAVNVAYPPGTRDQAWLRGLDAVVPPLLRAFRPDALVTQHGADSHVLDPLAHMALSVDAQRAAQVVLHDLAHEVCAGRWVALGGGGYEIVDVVPRTWAHLVGVAGHRPVDPATAVPESWRTYVAETLGRVAPLRMTDGADVSFRPFRSGHDTGEEADRAIMATRRAVFPLFGLDPWYD